MFKSGNGVGEKMIFVCVAYEVRYVCIAAFIMCVLENACAMCVYIRVCECACACARESGGYVHYMEPLHSPNEIDASFVCRLVRRW